MLKSNNLEGITEEHIQKWGWSITEQGWINFPDYQGRIYRNDKSIHWVNPVHEVVEGLKKFHTFHHKKNFCLYHLKILKDKKDKIGYMKTYQIDNDVIKDFEEIKPVPNELLGIINTEEWSVGYNNLLLLQKNKEIKSGIFVQCGVFRGWTLVPTLFVL